MKLNKKDKDGLIILGVFIFIIAFIAIVFNTSRAIPLKAIGAIIMIIMLALQMLVSKKYLKLYKVDAGWKAFIPIFNAICIFEPWCAVLLVIALVVVLLAVVVLILPSNLVVGVIGMTLFSQLDNILPGIMVLTVSILLVVMGIGYDLVYSDLRNMYQSATGMRRPSTELANFILMLVPGVNILGLTAIISLLGTLNSFGYSPLDTSADETSKLSEVN